MEQKTTTYIMAYNMILEKIIKMEFKPGEVVTEVSIAETLGLSRTPVREALQKLESEGLIITDNRTKRIYYLAPKDIENIFDLKIAIESFAVMAAARKGTHSQMEKLSKLVSKIRQLGIIYKEGISEKENFFSEWFEAERKFHNLIFEMADNARAEQIIIMLNMQWLRIKTGISAMEGRILKAVIEHEEIGNAVISRNEKDAEKAVQIHYDNLKNELMLLMRTFS
jgi:DNA-binding GntR family transcriptional regulator